MEMVYGKCFMVVRGCIHLYLTYRHRTDDGEYVADGFVTELWRMDGDGDEDWTKVVDTYKEVYSYYRNTIVITPATKYTETLGINMFN